MQTDPGFAPTPATASATGPRRRTALIVDDDIEVASMTAMALGTQGWHAIVTNAPEDAAMIAHGLPIDLLVTDLRMPGMSGLELAAHVRAEHANLPVVLVSGSPESSLMTLDPPFVFVSKPFRLQALFAAIGSLADDGARGRSGRVS